MTLSTPGFADPKSTRIQFDDFEIDVGRRELVFAGAPAHLPSKAFDVLFHLIENRDRVVTKSELLDRFWGADISEAALTKAVSQIRKVLSLSPTGADAIRTSYGLGFTFALPVRVLSSGAQLRERHWATVLVVRDADAAAAHNLVKEQGGQVLADGATEIAFYFGTMQPMDDAARRAVYCADMLRRMDVGVRSGVVTARINANANEDLPEAEARALARRTRAGKVLMDSETRDQLLDEIETEPDGEDYSLIALSLPHPGVPQRRPGRQPRTVGRDSEMAFLTSRIAMLGKGNNGQAMVLLGPPGIGKTRLLGEFLRKFASSDTRIERLQCLPALCNTALAPLQDLCRALFPVPSAASLEGSIDNALFAELVGAAGSDAALASLSDHQRDQRLRDLFFRLMKTAATERALIIAVEDVHWIDASSRGCLEYLVQRIGETGICLVMTSRPVEGPALAEVVLPLAPLGRIESLELLRDPALSSGIEDEAAEALVRRAAGNPFFIEELARASQAGADPAKELPQTIHAVIALRISALDVSLRQLLLCAAVIGPPAPLMLIARLVERDAQSIKDELSELIRREFLTEEKDGFVFRHMLIQDTAYDMLAGVERRRLHAIAADVLAETSDTSPERLAFHHQSAGRVRRAIASWRDASRAALQRSALNEAVAFARNGIDLCASAQEGDREIEIELQLFLARALTALKGFGSHEVGTAYARAEDLLAGSPPSRARIRVLVGLWIHSWVRGRLSESLSHATSILQIAKHAGDPYLTLQAYAGLGQVQFHQGDMQTAHQNLAAGLAAIDAAPPPTMPAQNAATSCATYLSWTEALMGDQAQARASLARSRALSTMRDNPYAEAIHYALATGPLLLLGEVEACLEHAQRAEALSREHDFAFWLGTGLVVKGWCLGQSGTFDPAFEALEEGIAVFEATDAGVQLANWRGLRAEVMLAAGECADGLAEANKALGLAEDVGDLWFAPRIHATASRLAAALGRDDEAAAHLANAKAMATQFGMDPRAVKIT